MDEWKRRADKLRSSARFLTIIFESVPESVIYAARTIALGAPVRRLRSPYPDLGNPHYYLLVWRFEKVNKN
jgi:hypothetical protein